MAVTLSLIKHPADVVLTRLSFTCSADGAVIGRGNDVAWTLADPRRILSARHCQISVIKKQYFLTDLSTNGTFLNDSKTPLGRGIRALLQDGDRISLGDYRLQVSILAEGSEQPQKAKATAANSASSAAHSDRPATSALSTVAGLGPAVASAAPPSALVGAWHSHKPAASPDKSRPVMRQVGSGLQSDNLEHSQAVSQMEFGADDGEGVLQALGLRASDLSNDERARLAAIAGQMLRESLAGLMQILQARASIKNEFRLCVTTIQPAENNPIKFSATVDDAVKNLFLQRSPAFKTPVAAVKDGFEAIADHQIATMAGLRAGFKALLTNFDPLLLEQTFQQKRKGRLDLGKGRYWRAYQNHFRNLSEDMDKTFHDLFGDDFVLAYENQLSKLAKAREPASQTE